MNAFYYISVCGHIVKINSLLYQYSASAFALRIVSLKLLYRKVRLYWLCRKRILWCQQKAVRLPYRNQKIVFIERSFDLPVFILQILKSSRSGAVGWYVQVVIKICNAATDNEVLHGCRRNFDRENSLPTIIFTSKRKTGVVKKFKEGPGKYYIKRVNVQMMRR